jgi:hypothetical protein
MRPINRASCTDYLQVSVVNSTKDRQQDSKLSKRHTYTQVSLYLRRLQLADSIHEQSNDGVGSNEEEKQEKAS